MQILLTVKFKRSFFLKKNHLALGSFSKFVESWFLWT